jgi:Cu(I)/Ag(I) efflux system periplasmic protein CusF
MLLNNGFRVPRTGILVGTLLLGMASVLLASADVHAQGMQKMDSMPGMGGGGQKAATTASGTGTVIAVNAASRKVTLDHGPIPAIKWGAMKMEFATAPSVDLSKIKAGDKVQFMLSGSGSTYTVQSNSPAQ